MSCRIVSMLPPLTTSLCTPLTSSKSFMKFLFCTLFFYPTTAFSAPSINILIFGDSLSSGYGISSEQSWPSLLAKKLVVDKGQFSRWQSGEEGIKWEKFTRLMDVCGNDAPLLWMLHSRGYELESVRRLESETERALREAREQLQVERAKVRVLTEALTGRAA